MLVNVVGVKIGSKGCLLFGVGCVEFGVYDVEYDLILENDCGFV